MSGNFHKCTQSFSIGRGAGTLMQINCESRQS
jgi:hypothetical protein